MHYVAAAVLMMVMMYHVGTFNTISVNSLKPYLNLTVLCFHCFVIWHVVLYIRYTVRGVQCTVVYDDVIRNLDQLQHNTIATVPQKYVL